MSSQSSAEQPGLPPPATLAIHLDLLGGLAGDMFVAALVDAVPGLAPLVMVELAAVRPAGVPEAGFSEPSTGGVRAKRFGATAATDKSAYRFAPASHAGTTAAPSHGDVHAGARYQTLRQRIVDAPLSLATREHALALLALLADAEAHVHGIAVDDVHFHELADWDSLLDIVADGCIVAALDGVHWSASAPPLGNGTVRTEHGLLPVPAPATSRLLEGDPWHDDGIGGGSLAPARGALP